MVLKKQTVWLLTMLSLIVVLSVYYMTSSNEQKDFAYNDEEEMETSATSGDVSAKEEPFVQIEEVTNEENSLDEVSEVTSMAREDIFTSIRLERDAQREKMLEQYTNIIASNDSPAELQAKALENKDRLLSLEQKESMLETLIRAKGYKDVLVITNEEDNEVKIIVQADELSRKEANEIMMMAAEHLGEKKIAVAHQPEK